MEAPERPTNPGLSASVEKATERIQTTIMSPKFGQSETLIAAMSSSPRIMTTAENFEASHLTTHQAGDDFFSMKDPLYHSILLEVDPLAVGCGNSGCADTNVRPTAAVAVAADISHQSPPPPQDESTSTPTTTSAIDLAMAIEEVATALQSIMPIGSPNTLPLVLPSHVSTTDVILGYEFPLGNAQYTRLMSKSKTYFDETERLSDKVQLAASIVMIVRSHQHLHHYHHQQQQQDGGGDDGGGGGRGRFLQRDPCGHEGVGLYEVNHFRAVEATYELLRDVIHPLPMETPQPQPQAQQPPLLPLPPFHDQHYHPREKQLQQRRLMLYQQQFQLKQQKLLWQLQQQRYDPRMRMQQRFHSQYFQDNPYCLSTLAPVAAVPPTKSTNTTCNSLSDKEATNVDVSVMDVILTPMVTPSPTETTSQSNTKGYGNANHLGNDIYRRLLEYEQRKHSRKIAKAGGMPVSPTKDRARKIVQEVMAMGGHFFLVHGSSGYGGGRGVDDKAAKLDKATETEAVEETFQRLQSQWDAACQKRMTTTDDQRLYGRQRDYFLMHVKCLLKYLEVTDSVMFQKSKDVLEDCKDRHHHHPNNNCKEGTNKALPFALIRQRLMAVVGHVHWYKTKEHLDTFLLKTTRKAKSRGAMKGNN